MQARAKCRIHGRSRRADEPDMRVRLVKLSEMSSSGIATEVGFTYSILIQ
jgi:hypothetical protein